MWSTATLCRALSLENVTQISAKLVQGYSVDMRIFHTEGWMLTYGDRPTRLLIIFLCFGYRFWPCLHVLCWRSRWWLFALIWSVRLPLLLHCFPCFLSPLLGSVFDRRILLACFKRMTSIDSLQTTLAGCLVSCGVVCEAYASTL